MKKTVAIAASKATNFSVYSLNGQYLFHEQVYMEWKRPPLLPVILWFFPVYFLDEGLGICFHSVELGVFPFQQSEVFQNL
ncbi:hypothetical protein HRED_10806 [Candidatus Haloredivivus sp. G17]|nr:hypothetical protein HRED_10806 [Candidatus Haloredivivus sp. G17]